MNATLIDLFRSIKQNDNEKFKNLILKGGFDLNQYLYGVTPLFYSIECKNEIMSLELLRNSSIDPFLKSNLGLSCLEKAMENKLFKVVEVLSKKYKKIDLNKSSDDNETLLTKCIKCYDQTCAVLLIEAGVDVNIPNKSNEYPLELAIKSNKIKVSESLLKSKTNSNLYIDTLPNNYTPLLDACENDFTEIAIKLIDAGANVNIIDQKYLNWTPIMYSITNHNEQLTVYLIEKNCNVNQNDLDLNTPLHLATDTENEYLVKKLLNAGAKKTLLNKSNMTALDIAKENEDDTMVSLLLK